MNLSNTDELLKLATACHQENLFSMDLMGGNSSCTPEIDQFDESKPLWKYVTKLEKFGGGGNYQFQCNFCKNIYKGSYTRVKAHLLKQPGKGISVCKNMTTYNLAKMQNAIDEVESRNKYAQPVQAFLPPPSLLSGGMSYSQGGAYESKKRKTSESGNDNGSESASEKALNKKDRDHLHCEIGRMFYSAGLPIQLARNPYFISSYSFAANHNMLGYLPPSYKLLRTTLLQKERENIDRLLQPIKRTWREKGVSIVSDGWSDSPKRPLINLMAVTDGQAVFLKAIDCSVEIDEYFIAISIKNVINEVGSQNVVQVITDNAPICKAAGQLIEAEFPHILWTPSVVHTLNLALKDICAAKKVGRNEMTYEECGWISDIAGDVTMIKDFITNDCMKLDIYKECVSLKLLLVAETRFASTIVMFKRFKLLKCSLLELVISDNWNCYRQHDIEKARIVKKKVTDDVWWDSIDYILSFTAPIYDMLRACDTGKPCLHLVYEMWNSMIEKVKTTIYRHEGKGLEEDSTFYAMVHHILKDRWNENSTPLYCLAHSLNPRYYSDEWLHENPTRVPPYRNEEVALERNKCLKRYFDDPVERHKVMLEIASFSIKMDSFADYDSIKDRWNMDPHSWWVLYGTHAPSLQNFALKLLAQPSSSSCCERNWKTYSFVQSVRNSNMNPQRAEDLVFIHNNLRLLSRRTSQYVQGQSKMWDIAGDDFDSHDDVGLLAVTNLSLDEPELEAVLFTDDGGNEDQGDDYEDVEVGSN